MSYQYYRRHRTDLGDDPSTVDVTPSTPVPTHEVPRPSSTLVRPRDGRVRVNVNGLVSTSGPVGSSGTRTFMDEDDGLKRHEDHR